MGADGGAVWSKRSRGFSAFPWAGKWLRGERCRVKKNHGPHTSQSPDTWLYRIGINTAKNYLVTQGRRAPTSTEADAEEAETFDDGEHLRDINTPESMLATKQIAETVNFAMEALPEELRIAITLREIEGLSYEEIAESMHCPIGTVRSRIFRAREAIAEKLRPLLDTAGDKRW